MSGVTVYHVDAFSREAGRGNPAGVVLNPGELTELQMQSIAKQVGFNETAFLLPSSLADLRIRYFTPGHEVNLCGHATIATIYAMKTKGLLGKQSAITIETKAGILPIRIEEGHSNQILITMQQAAPEFMPFNGSPADLAACLGLGAEDIDPRFPILYGSTGLWTLLLPIRSLSAFKRMSPDNNRFPDILKELPHASLHPFCLETYDTAADMHGRHFSSPYSGTIEDPVTGTASGVMGAYYSKYIRPDQEHLELLIEQGQEIGRNGSVRVTVNTKRQEVAITGTAVFAGELTIPYKE